MKTEILKANIRKQLIVRCPVKEQLELSNAVLSKQTTSPVRIY